MKGRFRRACIRWARRAGSSERVKFAEDRREASRKGGLPCLSNVSQEATQHLRAYLTRSASVSGRRGLAASLYISSSEIVAFVGGCDHSLISGGNGCAVPEAEAHLRCRVGSSRVRLPRAARSVNMVDHACRTPSQHCLVGEKERCSTESVYELQACTR